MSGPNMSCPKRFRDIERDGDEVVEYDGYLRQQEKRDERRARLDGIEKVTRRMASKDARKARKHGIRIV